MYEGEQTDEKEQKMHNSSRQGSMNVALWEGREKPGC
jgi:hypothetical protein